MTIYRTLLTRGYFPKELPPHFYPEQFAKYATSVNGRAKLANYPTNSTDSIIYSLALPGQNLRELRLVHPVAFSNIAQLVAKNFGRLLKLSARSSFARSRPVYVSSGSRAIRTMTNPGNLARERSAARAGASFLLKADVSQFYPSLYTHSVAWAIDPKVRLRPNWHRQGFLGNQVDQALMNASSKKSQGLAIGNDISFLLAEGVLAQVDRATGFPKARSYRWFDDYEIAFETRDSAERGLASLRKELARFSLRLNPLKTKIIELPKASQEPWQQRMLERQVTQFKTPDEVVKHFDLAFRLRDEYPESPVLLYAIGILFKCQRPSPDVGRIAESCITQAVLGEPGSAQKAFALLSFWNLNGFALNIELLRDTICQIIVRHKSKGATSDVAWALAFSLQHNISLDKRAAKVLSQFDDDCIVLQALHLNASGLLPNGFSITAIQKMLKYCDLDREHWLLAYESVRHGFLRDTAAMVNANPVFSDLLAKRVTFYRTQLPSYALVLHLGGAPEWTLRRWLEILRKIRGGETVPERPESEVFVALERDIMNLIPEPENIDSARESLLDAAVRGTTEAPDISEFEAYV